MMTFLDVCVLVAVSPGDFSTKASGLQGEEDALQVKFVWCEIRLCLSEVL